MSKFPIILMTTVLAAGALFLVSCGGTTRENERAAVEAVKITVSTSFEPKSVEVKKGEPVKLIFFRKDGENCGDEISFPDLNIKKNLPVGEEVPVEFTPPEAGEIAFTCGMNMMRGKVIVQ